MKRRPSVEIVRLSVPHHKAKAYRARGYTLSAHDGHHHRFGLIASKPAPKQAKRRGKR